MDLGAILYCFSGPDEFLNYIASYSEIPGPFAGKAAGTRGMLKYTFVRFGAQPIVEIPYVTRCRETSEVVRHSVIARQCDSGLISLIVMHPR